MVVFCNIQNSLKVTKQNRELYSCEVLNGTFRIFICSMSKAEFFRVISKTNLPKLNLTIEDLKPFIYYLKVCTFLH